MIPEISEKTTGIYRNQGFMLFSGTREERTALQKMLKTLCHHRGKLCDRIWTSCFGYDKTILRKFFIGEPSH